MMSTTVGTFEAQTRFTTLLDLVELGEEVIITRNGRPVARLLAFSHGKARDARQSAIRRISDAAEDLSLGGIGWRDHRDAGRKY